MTSGASNFNRSAGYFEQQAAPVAQQSESPLRQQAALP